MRNAKSAKAVFALGATLFATSGVVLAAGLSSEAMGSSTSETAGIDAGGVKGIDAGGVLGIDAGGVRGIDAGGVLGIDAGGVRGIDAGGVLGIDAGGVRGIDAGGVLGIDAGGVRGIDAGGVLGIDAGGVLLAGPIDSIDRTNGVFQSMGQFVMASQEMLGFMSVGDYVTVGGSIVAPGWLYADNLSISNALYVPGATDVFVSGILSSVDTRNGTARIGDLTVDYTPTLGAAEAPSGLVWSFGGKRPNSRGILVSESSIPR